MKFLPFLFLAAFIFCLTYNPKNRQATVGAGGIGEPCCSNNQYMAGNPTQCRNAHYRGVQFANSDYGCPQRHPLAHQGAIIGP